MDTTKSLNFTLSSQIEDGQKTTLTSLSNLAALLRQQLFIFRDLWAWLNTPLEGPPAAKLLCEQLPMPLMW